MTRHLAAIVAVSMLLSASCGTDEEPIQAGTEAERPFILASTSLLGDMVENVVDGFADVEVLVPLGDDPTTYQLTNRQRGRLRETALIVSVGAGFEAGAQDDLEAAAAEGVDHFELSAATADPIPGPEEGTTDPYSWLDPERTADAVLALGNRLGEASAVLATAEVTDAAAAYARSLRESSQAINASLVDLEHRAAASGTRSLAYFAERYDLDVVVEIDPEATRRDLDRAVRQMKDADATVVLASTFEAEAIAKALTGRSKQRLEVQALHIDDLGEPTSAEGTYLGLLDELARLVKIQLR